MVHYQTVRRTASILKLIICVGHCNLRVSPYAWRQYVESSQTTINMTFPSECPQKLSFHAERWISIELTTAIEIFLLSLTVYPVPSGCWPWAPDSRRGCTRRLSGLTTGAIGYNAHSWTGPIASAASPCHAGWCEPSGQLAAPVAGCLFCSIHDTHVVILCHMYSSVRSEYVNDEVSHLSSNKIFLDPSPVFLPEDKICLPSTTFEFPEKWHELSPIDSRRHRSPGFRRTKLRSQQEDCT